MLSKPTITPNDARRHLHDLRDRREKQVTWIVEQCQQLQIKHKRLFNEQWKCPPKGRSMERKYEAVVIKEEKLPKVKELTNCFFESSSILWENQKLSDRCFTPKKKKHERCSSVSTVTSIDKRSNRVYGKWPDHNEINRIVGYPLLKPPPPPPVTPASPVIEVDQKKRKKLNRFVNAAKLAKAMSTTAKETPPIIEPPPPIIEKPVTSKVIEPTLPTILCPSSELYSKRIRTRQWLVQNDFTSQSVSFI